MGLEGVGMLREPMVEVLGLRIDNRSSFSPTPSPTPLGLRLGCAAPATPGPPWQYKTGKKGTRIIDDTGIAAPTLLCILIFCLTEVRVPSLAVVSGGTALWLVGGGGSCARGGGGGGGVFASSVGDGASPDSGQTETAAGPSDSTVQLRDTRTRSE